MKKARLGLAVAVIAGIVTTAPPAVAESQLGAGAPEVSSAVRSDTSARLDALATRPQSRFKGSSTPPPPPNKPNPAIRLEDMAASDPAPPVIPDPTGPSAGPMPAADDFAGIPNRNGYYPPDPTGDVGPNHYVQAVNASVAVYDKATGEALLGPTDTNTLFSGFGGACEIDNDGDPIVVHDQLADRWLISQFAVSTGPMYYECVAVSATSDPTGSYHRYAFAYDDMNDYPKIGVWPDGYYVTYNMFGDNGFAGMKVCALERSAMISGDPASQQCFTRATEFSMLPSDLDGPTPPPAGAPNYLLGEHWSSNNLLTMYRFAVDWDTPANTSLSAPVHLNVNPYVWACWEVTRTRCIPQPETAVRLESLGTRAMFRLAYRNFGDHESLVASHTVAMDGNGGLTAQTGIGWYEIRSPSAASPVVHQQGTSADPNGTYRWVPSIAMDNDGNMALGYSASSSAVYPSIRYTGRLATDPLNTMTQAETTMIAGGGSQTGTAARWGDYTQMSVDPEDDCTFWYTNQYLTNTSQAGWSTRIGHFKYPSCTAAAAPDAPSSPTATAGNASATVSWTAPAANGSPIRDYEVTSTQGSKKCTTSGTSCTVTGLSNGTSYTFTVSATNYVGTSGPSGATAPVTPAAATPDVSPASLNFSARVPLASAARTVTVTNSSDGRLTFGANALSLTGSGADRFGISADTCSARVLEPAGTCTADISFAPSRATDYSAQLRITSDAATPSTVALSGAGVDAPSPPQGLVATTGPDSVELSWSAPASNGNSPVTGYTVTSSDPGKGCETNGLRCTITGLKPATGYRFSVTASNAVGTSPAAATDVVTAAPVAQTASVSLPAKIKRKGRTVLLSRAVFTNASQRLTPSLTVTPASRKFSRASVSPDRVEITTKGKRKLKVTLVVSAPATGRFAAYNFRKTWTVRKAG